jgi:hypothetical protein
MDDDSKKPPTSSSHTPSSSSSSYHTPPTSPSNSDTPLPASNSSFTMDGDSKKPPSKSLLRRSQSTPRLPSSESFSLNAAAEPAASVCIKGKAVATTSSSSSSSLPSSHCIEIGSLPAVRTSSLPAVRTSSSLETSPYIPRYELAMTPRGTTIYFIDPAAAASYSNQKITLKIKLSIAAAITSCVLYLGYTVRD